MRGKIIEILKKWLKVKEDFIMSEKYALDKVIDELEPLINAEVERRIAERTTKEEIFMSPIKDERAWQQHCLSLLFDEYPNMCKWQLMNSLIHWTGIATGIELPPFDE